MNALPQHEELMKVYHFLRYDAGLVQSSTYKIVREWFLKQFPEYNNNPLYHIQHENKVIDISSILKQQEKIDA